MSENNKPTNEIWEKDRDAIVKFLEALSYGYVDPGELEIKNGILRAIEFLKESKGE